jgi:hypothetical protein
VVAAAAAAAAKRQNHFVPRRAANVSAFDVPED